MTEIAKRSSAFHWWLVHSDTGLHGGVGGWFQKQKMPPVHDRPAANGVSGPEGVKQESKDAYAAVCMRRKWKEEQDRSSV